MTRPTATLSLALAVGWIAVGALAGCEAVQAGAPEARGETEEVLVVTDSVTWAGPVGDALRETLGRPVTTIPSNQGAFKLVQRPLTRRAFNSFKMRPNVVFAAAIDAPGEVGEFLRARVGEGNLDALRAGDAAAVNLRPDLWANNQLVTIATAASDSALAVQILDRGDELREAYQALARVRTQNEMFSRLRQTDLEQQLVDEHGFRIGIQHDFVQVQDTAATAAGLDGDFVRYRRVLSDTWRDFFVFVADGAERLPTEAEADAITNDLLEQFARGVLDSSYVQIDALRPTTTDTTTINGHVAQEKRGFWYMTNDVMGGAFIRFVLRDPAADRLYLYYGMTFAPSRRLDKRKFLRQMEAIGASLEPGATTVPPAER